MKKKRKTNIPKKRNPGAQALESPEFMQRIVRRKHKYDRKKQKHKDLSDIQDRDED